MLSPPKPFKSFSRKSLGESVGKLFNSWNVFQLHCSEILNLSMLCMLRAEMVLWVRGQADGSLVVTTMIVAAFPWLVFNSLRSLLSQFASLAAFVRPRNAAS